MDLKLPQLVRRAGGKAGIQKPGSLSGSRTCGLAPLLRGCVRAAVAPGVDMCLHACVCVDAKLRLDTEFLPLHVLWNFYDQTLKLVKSLRGRPGRVARLDFASFKTGQENARCRRGKSQLLPWSRGRGFSTSS